MFIYFPEYTYKKLKSYFSNTFIEKLNETKAHQILQQKFEDSLFLARIENFSQNKINLPTLKFNHCNSLFTNEEEQNLGLISKYNRIDNKIEICRNYIKDTNHFSIIVDKELTYAFEYNIRKSKLSLNDYATMSIKACNNALQGQGDMNIIIKAELIKRCANVELKYKFKRELQNYYDEENLDNLKLNEIVRKLIDNNISINN